MYKHMVHFFSKVDKMNMMYNSGLVILKEEISSNVCGFYCT